MSDKMYNWDFSNYILPYGQGPLIIANKRSHLPCRHEPSPGGIPEWQWATPQRRCIRQLCCLGDNPNHDSAVADHCAPAHQPEKAVDSSVLLQSSNKGAVSISKLSHFCETRNKTLWEMLSDKEVVKSLGKKKLLHIWGNQVKPLCDAELTENS